MNEFEYIKKVCLECIELRTVLDSKCIITGKDKEGNLIVKDPNLVGVSEVVRAHNNKIEELRTLLSELPEDIQILMSVPKKIILKK